MAMASSDPSPIVADAYVNADFAPDDTPEQLKDDPVIAYFRRRFADRDQYLASLDDQKREKVNRELTRVKELRVTFENEERNRADLDLYLYRKAQWKLDAIKMQATNVQKLEQRLDEMMAVKKPHKLQPEDRNRRLEHERAILAEVAKWERLTLPPKPATLNKAENTTEVAKVSHVSRFMNIFKKNPPMPKAAPFVYPERGPDKSKNFSMPDDSYGITITQITLKKEDGGDSPFYKPDETQRYSFPLKQILKDEPGNPVRKRDGTDIIRYFHLPANNMHWVEEIIARYYGEKTPGEFDYRDSKNPPYLEKASNVLCRKYWTSLQHGSVYDPIHARHMRSHCSLITPETGSTTEQIKGSKNFIMFMPYLHWETHNRRKKMAKIVEELTQQHHRNRSHVTETLREELAHVSEVIRLRHARQLSGLRMFDEDENETTSKSKKSESKKEDSRKSKSKNKGPRKPLAEYLLQAAKLYEMMDIEPDVRVLRDHLHKVPPLHTRRTLDQSYYWKLPTTDGRDQDQVVYRATKTGKTIKRTSRVVMVDQLWMYVLDDNTIITSFPRRWGRNKPDWSGVHKSIRGRLEHLRDGEIQSVYDLALIIADQCSAVFFDRTKPVDERPEVLDIFSNALSHVSGMKTVAFETFWRQLNKYSSEGQNEESEKAARTYLNINPEGELLRETHDIIEELRMMIGIYSQQIHVMEEFSRHLETLHEKETSREQSGEGAEPSMLKVLIDIKQLLLDEQKKRAKMEQQDGEDKHDSNAIHGNENGLLPPETNDRRGSWHSGRSDETTVSVRTIPDHTLHMARDVCRDLRHRKEELGKLEENTQYVCDQLKSLLDLKQQQASIIEAKYALKRADESVLQGRSIMLFTIVTIIFLPMSFMSSVFGMNASDFVDDQGNNNMSLLDQFRLLFPISLGLILLSLLLAFSTWTRNIISFVFTIAWSYIYEYSYLRRVWLALTKKKKSEAMYTWQQKIVERVFSRKERAVMLRHWALAKEREERDRLAQERKERGSEGGGGAVGGEAWASGGAGAGGGPGEGNHNISMTPITRQQSYGRRSGHFPWKNSNRVPDPPV